MKKRYRVEPGERVRLRDFDPDDTGGLSEDASVRKRTGKDLETLSRLQELLYAARSNSVLIVLQAIDTGGKDGTIRHVFSGVNPQGCRVASFKVPTELEAAHDYLWRVHAQCPGLGDMMIFNRSHYESVLVERVHDLVPREVWKRRYDEINAFERLLARGGTIILKFMLTISKAEQKRRLLERERDPDKRWKSNPGDWEERKHWDDYQEAVDEMLSKTSTGHAPWFVIPANQKWYRNMLVADIITDALKKHRGTWERALRERGRDAVKGVRP